MPLNPSTGQTISSRIFFDCLLDKDLICSDLLIVHMYISSLAFKKSEQLHIILGCLSWLFCRWALSQVDGGFVGSRSIVNLPIKKKCLTGLYSIELYNRTGGLFQLDMSYLNRSNYLLLFFLSYVYFGTFKGFFPQIRVLFFQRQKVGGNLCTWEVNKSIPIQKIKGENRKIN